MGKSLPSPTKLQEVSRIITSNRLQKRPSHLRPVSNARPVSSPETAKLMRGVLVKSEQQPSRLKKMEESSQHQQESRVPLAEVVADCVKRWFQDTLKEAKAGNSTMQVLVGQMYCSGYGVSIDAQKGRDWITRASRSRSSICEVGNKRPGYNASDSDSDDMKGNAKQK